MGRCEVTATAQGAALTLLTIVPEWRRKGYGTYLLKEILRRFGGYDKGDGHRLHSPAAGGRRGAGVLGEVRLPGGGAQLCRRRTPDLTAVKFVQDFLTSRLAEPKLLVDATCGNGGDPAFLCRLARKEGRVLGFDIQPEAIASTERNLAAKGPFGRAPLRQPRKPLTVCHPRHGGLRAVQLRLAAGCGPHNVFSHASSSIPALEAALTALRPGGVLSAILYSGRVIGSDEKTEILNWMRALPLSRCTVLVCGFAIGPKLPRCPALC